MRRLTRTLAAVAVWMPAALTYGHGHPIMVSHDEDRLVVSGGVLDDAGFAERMFYEVDSDGDLKGFDSFSGFGPAIYWDVPGFVITGLAENSGLYLQTLARPVKDANPANQRVLWYWSPLTNQVEDAPASQFQVRKSAAINILLTPTMSIAPPPIQVAAPVAGDMNRHNHDLLKYLLPLPEPTDGAYGFFARLTSDVYAPSDPFLVVINHGFLEGEQMTEAALATNAAAVAGIPGDYNDDGIVDAADYTVWRNNLGEPTEEGIHHNGDGHNGVDPADYDWWKQHYGNSMNTPGSGGNAAAIPEPPSWLLAFGAMLGIAKRRRSHG